MSTHKSQQLNQIAVPGYGNLKPNELGGRMRIAWFEFNTTDDLAASTALAEFDTLLMTKLPAGARLLAGYMMWEAMGTAMVCDVGLKAVDNSGYLDLAGTVADDKDKLTAAQLDVAAAGQSAFNHLAADAYGYVTEKELYLTLTPEDTGGEGGVDADPWAADKDIYGYIMYVVD